MLTAEGHNAPAPWAPFTRAGFPFGAVAMHCNAGNARCASANNGKADLLPDEPGGYSGFNALCGAR
jgi:hypothetical protein